jgi:hypothetical protein
VRMWIDCRSVVRVSGELVKKLMVLGVVDRVNG